MTHKLLTGFLQRLERIWLKGTAVLQKDLEEAFVEAYQAVGHAFLLLISPPRSLHSNPPLSAARLPNIKNFSQV
jgi:hypothetical protein